MPKKSTVNYSYGGITHLELFVHLICEVAEEVKGILLFSHIHRLAPELELLPERLRGVILQSALHQVPKHALQLWKDPEKGGRGRVGMIARG